jgi:hypothetical protein
MNDIQNINDIYLFRFVHILNYIVCQAFFWSFPQYCASGGFPVPRIAGKVIDTARKFKLNSYSTIAVILIQKWGIWTSPSFRTGHYAKAGKRENFITY